MGKYSLVELVNLTGIQGATIRVWERRYNIIKPHRTKTNRRFYDDDDLRRLLNINTLYRSGVKISKIASITPEEIEDRVKNITSDFKNFDASINSMIEAMISFNKQAVNEILLRSLINKGFEETFVGLVFPFLMRVGVLWQTSNVNTGAEHFISNILRGRLISAIDALIPTDYSGKKRVIMFLPENEQHELSLLFYEYLIVKMGHQVIYLGQSTPLDAVIEVHNKWGSDVIVTGLISSLTLIKTDEYVKILSSTFTKQQILVAGLLADEAEQKTYPNVYALRSVSDLMSFLS